jgi:hypothetical protein
MKTRDSLICRFLRDYVVFLECLGIGPQHEFFELPYPII